MSVLEVPETPLDSYSATPKGRLATPLPTPSTPTTLLSSLTSHLPSSPLLKLSSLLPSRPLAPNPDMANSDIEFADEDSIDVDLDSPPSVRRGRVARSLWQRLDLRDGRGERVFLIQLNQTPHTVLQIWDCTHSASPAVSEFESSAPEEVVVLNRLPGSGEGHVVGLYDQRGVGWQVTDGSEVVVDVKMFLGEVEGKVQGLLGILVVEENAGEEGTVALLVLELEGGRVSRKIVVGKGWGGQLLVSPKTMVVSLASHTPSIHLISPHTLHPLSPPLTSHLATHPQTALPILSLSHRLLAYVTTESRPPPSTPGIADPEFGTIVTRYSAEFHARRGEVAQGMGSPQLMTVKSVQTAVLNTAASISVEVGKGVWSGLKGLSSAVVVSARGSGMLSKSAPCDTGLAVPRQSGREASRSPGRVVQGFSPTPGGRRRSETRVEEEGGSGSGGRWIKVLDLHPRGGGKPTLLAHFALPDQTSSPLPTKLPPTVTSLSLSPLGTSLCAFTRGGRGGLVVELRPAGPGQGKGMGEVWSRFELKRGVTNASVSAVEWDKGGRWVAVGTQRTIHVFAIRPEGGLPDLSSHLLARNLNPADLQPLSVRLSPIRRLRPCATPVSSPFTERAGLDLDSREGKGSPPPVFCFGSPYVERSEGKGGQEVLVCRGGAVVEGWRLGVYDKEVGGLGVRSGVMGRWSLGGEEGEMGLRSVLRGVGKTGGTIRGSSKRSFAAVELETYSSSPKMVPGTIYKERSVLFRSLTSPPGPILSFRKSVQQVAVSSSSPDEGSDEPLLTALHSHLNLGQPRGILPALPNGRGHQGWVGQPTKAVLHTAKDIVRMTRKPSRVDRDRETSKESGFAMIGADVDSIDEDGGLFDAEGGLEDMTNGSSADETTKGEGDEDWQDDLGVGVMEMDDVVRAVAEEKSVGVLEGL